MGDVTGLVERLEKATEGSSNLNAAIWFALFKPEYRFPEPVLNRVPDDLFEAYERFHWDGGGGYKVSERLPDYTRSVDDALALVERVLPGWDICLSRVKGDQAATWNAVFGEPDSFSGSEASSPTPALALCLAALKALAQGNEG